MADKSLEHRLVARWAQAVNAVLLSGMAASVLVIGARLFGGSKEVKLFEIDHIPLNGAWVLLVVGTLAHFFAAYFFYRSIQAMRAKNTRKQQLAAYEDVVADGGLFVGVAVRRLPEAGRQTIKMSRDDPSTWIANFGVVAALLAALPWWWDGTLRWPGWETSLRIALVSTALLILNWMIGSVWAVELSRLGLPEEVKQPPPKGFWLIRNIVFGTISVSAGLYLLLSFLISAIAAALARLTN